ncbi:hypothetical protein [Mixta intestinalis]|jgi:hypothetical protein|nr:hypothetical protein [Mixta intestinalis]
MITLPQPLEMKHSESCWRNRGAGCGKTAMPLRQITSLPDEYGRLK